MHGSNEDNGKHGSDNNHSGDDNHSSNNGSSNNNNHGDHSGDDSSSNNDGKCSSGNNNNNDPLSAQSVRVFQAASPKEAAGLSLGWVRCLQHGYGFGLLAACFAGI